MKTKTVTILTFIGVLIFLFIGFYMFEKNEHAKHIASFEKQRIDFSHIISSKDSLLTEWVNVYNQIENDVYSIKEKENIIIINKQKLANNELSTDQKSKLLNDISYLKNLIDSDRKKIIILNEKIKVNNGIILGLQNKITELDSFLKENEQEITALKTTLDKKNTQITELTQTVDTMSMTITQKNQVIANQIKEMNKAYVLTGTYKGLKEKGLITKTGGFVGIGGNKTLASNFSNNSFVLIDKSQYKTIYIDAKSIKLITEHPLGSYKIIGDKNKVTAIEITNPNDFWKISKYCVVVVK